MPTESDVSPCPEASRSAAMRRPARPASTGKISLTPSTSGTRRPWPPRPAAPQTSSSACEGPLPTTSGSSAPWAPFCTRRSKGPGAGVRWGATERRLLTGRPLSSGFLTPSCRPMWNISFRNGTRHRSQDRSPCRLGRTAASRNHGCTRGTHCPPYRERLSQPVRAWRL